MSKKQIVTRAEASAPWQLASAILLVGGILGLSLFSHVNLLFGLEKTHGAQLLEHQVLPGAKTTAHVLVFRLEDGRTIKTKVDHSFVSKVLPTEPDQVVQVKTDGFFWRTVVAVDRGEGFREIP